MIEISNVVQAMISAGCTPEQVGEVVVALQKSSSSAVLLREERKRELSRLRVQKHRAKLHKNGAVQ